MTSFIKKVVSKNGFSLIEMSVVLGIVGLIAVGSIGLYSEQHTNALKKGSEAKLVVVKKALLEFALVNKYMPCPDSTGTGIDDRTAATGTVPAIAAVAAVSGVAETATDPAMPPVVQVNAQAAIPNVGVNVCSVNSGTVPYAAIGLSVADVQDSSGNFFIYAVDQGVTVANNMLNCPTDTACFFNGDAEPALPAGNVLPGSVLPAFDLTTTPLMGALGPNNLRVCGDIGCVNVEADGLVAVLVALNANGGGVAASNEEAENRDNDLTFVNVPHSDTFDDQILGIAGNEIKTRSEEEAVEIVTSTGGGGPIIQTGNDVLNGGSGLLGGVGDNNSRSTNIQIEYDNQSFDFGAENAGKTIVLNLDTLASGSWDYWGEGDISNDTAYINVNGTDIDTFQYGNEAIDGYLDSKYDTMGTEDTSDDVIYTGENSHTQYWSDSHEYLVQTDENGQINLELAVGTTGTDETVDFTNIVLTLYNTPPEVPDMPSVDPITGIDQTQGLN